METMYHVGESLPHVLIMDYIHRYKAWKKQRNPLKMGWHEVAYGYMIAMIDNITYLLQHCDYATQKELITKIKVEAPTLWTRVEEEMAKPHS